MIYLLDPRSTFGDSALAKTFFLTCRDELEQQTNISVIASEQAEQAAQAARSQPLGLDDALAFFSHPQQSYPPWVEQLLRTKVRGFPIAMTKEARFPGKDQSLRQSFDVPDELARRGLGDDNVATVAAVFSRVLLAAMQPTLTEYRMRIFLSHRRADGETIAREFHDELMKRVQHSFRDLTAVLAGEDAQDRIEQALVQSDAVIFLETPRTYESPWIAKELEMALSLNLPIVWISLGDVDTKKRTVLPGREPHLTEPQIKVTPELVDKSLGLAFDLARTSALRIFDSINVMKALCANHGCEPEVKDQNALVYSLTIPHAPSRYRELPVRHLVQFFGRWPKPEDQETFARRFEATGNGYDAGLLLAPIPAQLPENVKRAVSIDSAEEYVNQLTKTLSQPAPVSPKRGIIISGAFPDLRDNEKPDEVAAAQQNLIDAVHAFTSALFERQGIVIFGTHPTFVPLVFEMARRKRPRDAQQAVHLYVSMAFNPRLEDYDRHATVYATPKIEPPNAAQFSPQEQALQTRNLSLTEMRTRMIHDPQTAALVAIGGKGPREGVKPGVDEEIELARAAGVPVFLIGSAPGRAAWWALKYSAERWQEKLNGLSPQQNEELRTSLDYATLAEMVLSSVFKLD